MKKKSLPKYQFGDTRPQCGPNLVWDPIKHQCVPSNVLTAQPSSNWDVNLPANTNPDQQQGEKTVSGLGDSLTDFWMNNNLGQGANTDVQGNVMPSGILPLDANGQFDPTAGRTDKNGTFIPSQNVVPDALDKGFTMQADGKYHKAQITENKDNVEFNPFFKIFNAALDGTQLIAGSINDARNSRKERDKLLKARYGPSKYNVYEKGLNNVEAYFKEGGEKKGKSHELPPVTVTSASDPRFKKYQDSLSTYTKGRQYVGEMQHAVEKYNPDTNYKRDFLDIYDGKPVDPEKSDYTEVKPTHKLGVITRKNLSPEQNRMYKAASWDKKWVNEWNELLNISDKFTKLPVKPVAMFSSAELPPYPIYKKPVQPIVLEDERHLPTQRQTVQLTQTTGVPMLQPNLDGNVSPISINPPKGGKYSYTYMDANGKQATQQLNSKAEYEAAIKYAQSQHNFNSAESTANDGQASFWGKPEYKEGGEKASRQDSLNVYNNSQNVMNFYKNQKYNELSDSGTGISVDDYEINSKGLVTGNTDMINNGKRVAGPYKPEYQYKKIDDNKFLSRELTTGTVNIAAPPQLFDKRIKLQGTKTFHKNYANLPTGPVGDVAEVGYYDPVAVKPVDMLTPPERAERIRKYGIRSVGLNSAPAKVQPKIVGKPIPMPLTERQVSGLKPAQLQGSQSANTQMLQPNLSGNVNPLSTGAQPTQTNITQTQGQNNIQMIYGPSGGAIGNVDGSGNFIPLKDTKHLAKVNQADIDLLNNEDNMRTYLQDKYKGQVKFAKGGMKLQKFAFGGQFAELEKGEIYQDQDGAINKIPEQASTHEQGGNVVPNVHRVLEDTSDKRKDKASKNLLITPEEAKQLVDFKPKSSKSHSKLFEEAVDYHTKKFNRMQKNVEANVDYVQQGGAGVFAQNSLDENLKLLQNMPTAADIFDAIYNHQENAKQRYTTVNQKMQYGGKFDKGGLNEDSRKKAKKITDPKGWLPAGEYDGKKYFKHPGLAFDVPLQGPTKVNTRGGGRFTVDDILNQPDRFKTFAERTAGMPDDERRKAAEGLFQRGEMPSQYNMPVDIPEEYAYMENPVLSAPPEEQKAPGQPNDKYKLPSPVTPSKFNEPLRWYDVAGNVMNYLSSVERIPVDLEQLQRQPIKVHELNPLPTLLQNQGDFNAVAATLPQSGVGYANQSNLLGQKYKANNEVLGQYENMNKQRYDQVDQYNNQADMQLDQLNLGLRDQFTQRVLQGREVQRQSKLNALDDLFTKVAQNRALNRNGDLVLQLTPYFDQYGKFNGNKYDIIPSAGGMSSIIDKTSGKTVKRISSDIIDQTTGQLKTTKNTTVVTNK